MLVGVAGAVQAEVVVGSAQAVDGDTGVVLLAADGSRCGKQGTRSEYDELQRVAPVEREVAHVAAVDGGLNFGGSSLDQRRLTHDFRSLRSFAHLQWKFEIQ